MAWPLSFALLQVDLGYKRAVCAAAASNVNDDTDYDTDSGATVVGPVAPVGDDEGTEGSVLSSVHGGASVGGDSEATIPVPSDEDVARARALQVGTSPPACADDVLALLCCAFDCSALLCHAHAALLCVTRALHVASFCLCSPTCVRRPSFASSLSR